jgi:hypothetical protein
MALGEVPVMAGPGNGIETAEGRGHLPASHAGREQVIETLKAAFVQGVLVKNELDLRVGQAFAARTYAELAALTADLPTGLTAAQPSQPVRERDVARVRRPGAVLAVATVLYVIVWPVGAFLVPKNSEGESLGGLGLVALATVVYLAVLATRGWICSFRGRTSVPRGSYRRGQRPAQVVIHPPRPSPADRGGLAPVDPGRRHAAEAAPIVRPRLLPS